MQSLFFWKEWPREYRIIWAVLSFVFLTTLVFLAYSYFRGPDDVIHWQKLQTQKVVETPVHSFRLGLFQLSVPADNFVVFEYFHGTNPFPNTTAAYLFLTMMIVAVVVILSIVTTLPRFWYFVGMTLFIAFVAGFRLEVLKIFGQRNYIPTSVLLGLYLALSFYFHSFRSTTSFAVRLVSFLLLTLAAGLVIGFFSGVTYPMLHLAVTGYTAGLIFALIFIVTVAHEIFAGLFFISTQGKEKNLRHLGIITVIWFSNLIITYMHRVGAIHWNFVYLNLYLLLAVSACVGLWGFRNREVLYDNILSFNPFGGFFYLSLASIALSFTAFAIGNANDAVLRVVQDIIIFSQLGYGLVFLLYILSNFVGMLEKNIPVGKVLYKPNRMPYFTFRLGGLVVMLAFIFYSNWRSYVYAGVSGFYLNAADLYTMQGDPAFAETLYAQASKFAYQNNRSNYTLAGIETDRLMLGKAHEFYERANARPTPYSLVNDGNLFLWQDESFKAISAFSDANTRMPGTGPILNNLGFAYTKVHAIDSVARYLNEAMSHSVSRDAAHTNFFGMAVMEYLPIDADSILKKLDASATGAISNAMLLADIMHQPFEVRADPLKRKQLDVVSATFLNNYIVHSAKALDTAFTSEAYRIASDSLNGDFSEAIKVSLAFAYYHQGNVTRALNILAELAFTSAMYNGKYNYLMGLWALENSSPEIASSYFTYAETADYKKAKLYNAIALTELQRRNEALIAWDTVLRDQDPDNQTLALGIKKVLVADANAISSWTDEEKYQFCRYRISLQDSLSFNRLINTFQSSTLKAQALLDRARSYFKNDQIIPAIRYFNRISGLEIQDKIIYESVRYFELEMLASRGEISSLAKQINNGITFEGNHALEKSLYTAMISELSGDLNTAATHYRIAGTYNPYYEQGVISAARFFALQDTTGMKAYDILAEAIQVNTNSLRLLKAYAEQSARVGFDQYAIDVRERIRELERRP